jgi:hypothetical protein
MGASWDGRSDGFPTPFGNDLGYNSCFSWGFLFIFLHGVLMFLSFRVGNLCGPINMEVSIDYGFS